MFAKADCSKNPQIKNQRWSLHGFQPLHFVCDLFGCKLWLQSIQNHDWHRFQAFARSHLKSDSRWAVWFESEQTPFPRTGRQSGPAAWYRIRIGTCSFVSTSYFYSENNEWLQDWGKRWALLCCDEIYKALKPYWLLNWVRIARVVACFPQASRSLPAATAAY